MSGGRGRAVPQAKAGVARWITFYNHQRPHAAHGGPPPAVWFASTATKPIGSGRQ
jgi:transposase InsO family protein